MFDEQYDDYRLFELGALGSKQADHYSVSSEFRLARDTRLSLEGYVKDYANLPTWKAETGGLCRSQLVLTSTRRALASFRLGNVMVNTP